MGRISRRLVGVSTRLGNGLVICIYVTRRRFGAGFFVWVGRGEEFSPQRHRGHRGGSGEGEYFWVRRGEERRGVLNAETRRRGGGRREGEYFWVRRGVVRRGEE